ncbi:protein phosphatase 2c domain-containing protein [Cystoisospora suis]|uniref:Protein phosphatase 2c domain-containing protein n=1 Tax=Cystoisospora suis TaxID=483139 RepID=A0A2C6KHX2_9APIC|nr:protein phosphatase 2c domain-containing protein [Cystoisospora suis]
MRGPQLAAVVLGTLTSFLWSYSAGVAGAEFRESEAPSSSEAKCSGYLPGFTPDEKIRSAMEGDSEGRFKNIVLLTEAGMSVVAVTARNMRQSDQDAMIVTARLRNRPGMRLHALFDGHMSDKTARWLTDRAAGYFGELAEFTDEAIRNVFLRMDNDLGKQSVSGGSTGVFLFVEHVPQPERLSVADREIIDVGPGKPRPYNAKETVVGHAGTGFFKITVAHVGDSRALMRGSKGSLVLLTRDHLPADDAEKKRIKAAGGKITTGWLGEARINGRINMSRALGDHGLKNNPSLPLDKQLIIAVPEVRRFYALASESVFLACDGLFEGLELYEVEETISSKIRRTSLGSAIPEVVDNAIAAGLGDNVSVLYVHLGVPQGQPARVQQVVRNAAGETIAAVDRTHELEGKDVFSLPLY